MNKRTHRPERGILICIIVLLCFFLVTVIQADQRDTSDLADETIDFLKTLCQRYDNYADGQDAAELNIVLNKTLSLAEFAPGYLLSTQSYVSGYVSEMGLTGVLITDDALNPVTQADIAGLKPAVLLAEVLENPSLQNILQAHNKTFSQRLELNGTVYGSGRFRPPRHHRTGHRLSCRDLPQHRPLCPLAGKSTGGQQLPQEPPHPHHGRHHHPCHQRRHQLCRAAHLGVPCAGCHPQRVRF